MVTMAEVPLGAEEKNRYKDVLPSTFPPSLLPSLRSVSPSREHERDH